ncbi:MAG: isoleucine--tRNA ligase [Oscillospiraceae bacterium]|jgi:isoleucyl-tRNA synthetase|nr:isoleucine--tRNA ligase [Oscillospiraceae bacterium]
MFNPVSAGLDFQSREREISAFWKERGIFAKYMRLRDGAKPFVFYDGPPTANGRPHIGHVETRAFKDLIPRYRTMKGYDVLRKAGWDTHGLPVELEVEKQLRLDGKEQIEAYGCEPFIKECKRSVWTYLNEWRAMSEAVAFWVDMDDPYVTYENNYIESIWWSLKTIHDKGLLYEGAKTVPYCPRCGTALSSHEVAQGYKSVTETSVTVRFRTLDDPTLSILAWTTTPWTLPSNLALCVAPNERYATVSWKGERLILAEALLERTLKEGYTVERVQTGKELEGLRYVPLYGADVNKKAWFVVCDGYVTLDDGTGVVHIAPSFGEDDSRVGRQYNLPHLQRVDTRGRMTADAPFAGLFVKDADPMIINDLKERGLLFGASAYTHDYPFCWRCDTPLLYYARPTWFIRVTAVRDSLARANQSVNWLPDNVRDGRMGNFIENVIDWGLSRERYWGTPLPIWRCPNGHIHVIGSVAELRERGSIDGKPVPADIELHRPYIDAVAIKCPECGEESRRVKEVIDCWYDSGSMPFAQWHYPFENKERFESLFPADFICEAVDQTRGWFYTLLAISTLLFDKSPFKTCLVLGLVQDDQGRKMSKHLGNVISPESVLSDLGADAVRWHFYVSGAPWLPSRFSREICAETQRRFMGTLWNTYAFFILYANVDGYKPGASLDLSSLTTLDRWLLSRLNGLVQKVDGWLDQTRVTESARAVSDFVDELSNWYVRRSRERFWAKGMPRGKEAAFATLYSALVTLAKLLAPFTPFLSESLYQNLVRSQDEGAPESVHLCDYPEADVSLIDPKLESDMSALIHTVELGRACRSAANIKIRQPVAAVFAQGLTLPDDFAALAMEELNAKRIEFVSDARSFLSFNVKPQLRTLGPRYGKLLGSLRRALAEADGLDVVQTLDRGEPLRVELEGRVIELAREDLIIEPARAEGYVAESDGGVTVALDTTLTPELIEEGLARELISKIQQTRKDAGFDVTDRVDIDVKTTQTLAAAVSNRREMILSATLGVSLTDGVELAGAAVRDWDINGEPATVSVRKAR